MFFNVLQTHQSGSWCTVYISVRCMGSRSGPQKYLHEDLQHKHQTKWLTYVHLFSCTKLSFFMLFSPNALIKRINWNINKSRNKKGRVFGFVVNFIFSFIFLFLNPWWILAATVSQRKSKNIISIQSLIIYLHRDLLLTEKYSIKTCFQITLHQNLYFFNENRIQNSNCFWRLLNIFY